MKVINMKTGLLSAAVLFAACSTQVYAAQDQTDSNTQNAQAVASKTLHLPLDHGPRAQVTPWVNEQRRLRAQQGK